MKYNTFDFYLVYLFILFIYLYLIYFNSPIGQTPERILTRNDSKDAFSLKEVPFGGQKVKINTEPIFMPHTSNFGKKVDLENFWPKTLYNGDAHLQTTLSSHLSYFLNLRTPS